MCKPASEALFDAVEEFFRKDRRCPVEYPSTHPDESLDPVWQAYNKDIDAIDVDACNKSIADMEADR